MSVNRVLNDARLAGLQISVEEGKLAVSPARLLTDSLREAIREHKSELLEALSQPQERDDGWNRMRQAANKLGETVSDGQKQYQLWGITPRGAICFDGQLFRTIDLVELGL